MPKVFTSQSQRTGEVGEHIACRLLQNKGYTVIERNYTKKWGEIDIIARKGRVLHFFEVKSQIVSDFDDPSGGLRPEENLHARKVARLRRTIGTYLAEHRVQGEWQFHLLVVSLSLEVKEAKISILANIIL